MRGEAATFSIVIPAGTRNDFRSSFASRDGSAALLFKGDRLQSERTSARKNFDIETGRSCRRSAGVRAPKAVPVGPMHRVISANYAGRRHASSSRLLLRQVDGCPIEPLSGPLIIASRSEDPCKRNLTGSGRRKGTSFRGGLAMSRM